ncbi:MAG: hypothetical protein WC788_05605 [Candidatus Paceibacterota bacterium]|jgi:hypothetical protein
MKKKKIILSILVLVLAGAILYFVILANTNRPSDTSNPQDIKPTFVPPSAMPPLSVATDKTSYEYGENVKISVLAPGSKNIPPFAYCEITIKRTQSRDGKEIVTAGLEEKYVLDESSDECKEYRSGFIFDMDGSRAKSVEWNQLSCENGKIPAPAIPDDYSVIASCKVSQAENYTGPKAFSDARNIRISEDSSCKNKKIEISKAQYDDKGLLSVEIKNTGTENIENVRIYLDKCEDKRKVKDEKDSGKIKAGSSITETFQTQKNCKYALLNAHIDECYDHNPESWTASNIVIP